MKTITFAAVVLPGLLFISCEKKKDPSTGADARTDSTPPHAVRVTELEEFKVAEEEPATPEATLSPAPTPGQRLDHAIEKTEEGLDRAKDKTEEGLRKAAGKTGDFLQRTGEAIERKASGE